jgi:regulator of sirC expression with transglutaminase-like and TPR domain
VSVRDDAIDYLTRVGRTADPAIDLATAAVRLAAVPAPPLAFAPYDAHLAALVRAAAGRADEARTVETRVRLLARVIADEFGYVGDRETYDDLANADLMQVIDRRRGLPVALGILWLHVARALGWEGEGLNFPGHFLIRIACDGVRVVVDPFNGGVVLTAADLRELIKASAGGGAELASDHYAPVGNRDILLRLQNNIKLRHMNAQRFEAAGAVIDTMLLIAPDLPTLWREAGIVNAYLGNLTRAIGSLERFLSAAPADAAAAEADQILRQLRRKLN